MIKRLSGAASFQTDENREGKHWRSQFLSGTNPII